ncbi:MAG: double-stranded DNA-binding protein [Thaumarchaeota archaeon]|nr:double-stranded DNA-binding protein [Nitrososphaerota archaeon]
MTDEELEKLKAKRLEEMKKNISLKTKKPNASNKLTDREILIKKLGYRGLEVLTTAENQFPNETKNLIKKLSELILNGYISENIDGGNLLYLFRSIGLNVKMNNKININKDGKTVSLSDQLK